MIVSKTIEIDMGHRVPNHKSKCRNIHGHRYKICVGVDDKVITDKGASNEGMVIDFGDLKTGMMKCIDEKYDHSYTMYDGDEWKEYFNDMIDSGMKINIVDFVPTAENLARHWYHLMKGYLEVCRIKIKYITVWETPTSMARYEE